MNENKIAKVLDVATNTLGGGGSSVITSPFRLINAIKNPAKAISHNFDVIKKNKLLAKQKQAHEQQKKIDAAKKIEDVQKRQAALANKLEAIQQNKNAKQFNKNIQQGKIMNQLFPYSQRKEPLGIKAPSTPRPGENFKIDKTSPTGSKTGLTLRMPKPRPTKQQKLNKKIGQGLSNPVNYEDKIKNIMGVK